MYVIWMMVSIVTAIMNCMELIMRERNWASYLMRILACMSDANAGLLQFDCCLQARTGLCTTPSLLHVSWAKVATSLRQSVSASWSCSSTWAKPMPEKAWRSCLHSCIASQSGGFSGKAQTIPMPSGSSMPCRRSRLSTTTRKTINSESEPSK